ncbi:hypothetical protein LEP1GSC021_1077 [Leptospira noguchii str. 1993005606]|uniref:Lipoprotein n=2 Tax=Leptospira noguchii TaxID=28182 RepID=M6YLP7_9LEPT|nr:hypothetical protein [Leptospira noguchii]EMN02281.1 hypothetical protein LEP1GSC035_4505 [Leptospira noguchii str. 2007001578]EMO90504.1 hypothetical protein LEP1GSC024_1133 [Leptospira noguchii str. 2001034031]EPE81721.1 hypothetical protein LEP1GSC021_1077 [Leptospira noguchii str. 1993005606]
MKHTFKFSFLIFIFWFVQCSWVQERNSFFWPTNRNLIYNSEEIAYFHISPSKVDLFETLIAPGPFTHPTQLTPEQWKDLLGNLKYIKKSSLGFFTDYTFSDGELENIARDLPYVLKSLPEDKILVLISKYDDVQSVISLEERTTALIWGEKDKINLVFGKIKREIVDKSVGLDFALWTDIKAISLAHVSDGTEIADNGTVQFQTVRNILNRKWVIFNSEQLDQYKFKPRKRNETRKLTDENDRPGG